VIVSAKRGGGILSFLWLVCEELCGRFCHVLPSCILAKLDHTQQLPTIELGWMA